MNDYKYVGVGRDDGNRKGEFCAIFFNEKKYKLLRNSTFWLSENPNEVSIGWDAALERICTYALLETINGGNKIWVFNILIFSSNSLADCCLAIFPTWSK